jgi:hypothetical protein
MEATPSTLFPPQAPNLGNPILPPMAWGRRHDQHPVPCLAAHETGGLAGDGTPGLGRGQGAVKHLPKPVSLSDSV